MSATQHNLAIVLPGASAEIGVASHELAKDPNGLAKGSIPKTDEIFHHTKRRDSYGAQVLRFNAREVSGTYPYLSTFPGHWIIMKGGMIVK